MLNGSVGYKNVLFYNTELANQMNWFINQIEIETRNMLQNQLDYLKFKNHFLKLDPDWVHY